MAAQAPPFPTVAHPSLEAVPVSSEIRQIYPRDFFPNPNTVRLPLGKTAYWLFGPEDGPKVVLIHGISTPSILWKYIAPFLADNGFRVLVYDLYGRGYSEAPDTAYNSNLYITQLALLLQHVQFTQTHVIGLSMGGGVAAAFAATFPNLVKSKVVFISSVGLIEVPSGTPAVLPTRVPTGGPINTMLQLRQLQTECLPGYEHALASSLKEGPLRGLENAFKTIAETPHLKELIIHGTADGIVNYRFGLKIKELLPDADLVPMEGGDHDLVIADGYHEQVQAAILKFLKD